MRSIPVPLSTSVCHDNSEDLPSCLISKSHAKQHCIRSCYQNTPGVNGNQSTTST